MNEARQSSGRSRWAQAAAHWIGSIKPCHVLALGKAVGWLAYGAAISHRRIVRQNLAFIYPEWSRHTIDRLARRVFQHFGAVLFENLQALVMSRQQFQRRIVIEGECFLTAALAQPRGCLLISGHLGNWELGLLAGAAQFNRTALTVAKPVKFKLLNRLLTALRSRFGNRVVFKKGALQLMTRALKEGQTLIMLIDQGVRRPESVEIQFLGKRTLASPAAAYLAFRCRVPVVPLFCVRAPKGRYHLRILPPVVPQRTGDLRFDIQTFTQQLMRTVETAVRQYPEQWFWFHKRWKRTYPGLYPEYQVLRDRRRRRAGQQP
jgi:KDO2-lipid IV(A) lauroyltransferase